MDIVLDKQVVNKDSLKDLKNRRRARYEIKKKFEERCVFLGVVTIVASDSEFVFLYLQAQDGQEQMVLSEVAVLK